jgi:transcriptional regulator with PAS, ATPase and Fis domain
MPFSGEELNLLRTFSEIIYANPFRENRLSLEEELLGRRVKKPGAGGVSHRDLGEWESVVDDLQTRAIALLEKHRALVLKNPDKLGAEKMRLWRNAVRFAVYHQHRGHIDTVIDSADGGTKPSARLDRFKEIREQLFHYLPTRSDSETSTNGSGGAFYLSQEDADRTVSIFFQVRRVFRHIFNRLVGGSRAMSNLRAAVWEAIFTHNLELYYDLLMGRTRDFSILILGQSGTGKELVARAIGLGQFVAWSNKTSRFTANYRQLFLGCNIAQFAETLVESELFGYVKGAYTGAVNDGEGLLTTCPPGGVVFLDEVGDLSFAVQVKLLRVLQARQFSPVGSREQLDFHGRLVSATNRNIQQLVEQGAIREDFVYRLASTILELPTLQERFQHDPSELEELLQFILGNVLGMHEGPTFEMAFEQTLTPLKELVKANYSWPGNVRELEQAVRCLILHGKFKPVLEAVAPGQGNPMLTSLAEGELTMNEVRDLYCKNVYEITGNYQSAAKRLDVDWRTVKAAVNRLNGQS